MSITKKVVLKAFPTKRSELKEVLGMMVTESRKESGCLLYDLYEETKDIGVFHIIEKWEDEQSLAAHKLTPHFDQFKAVMPDLIESKESISLEAIEES